MRAVSLLVLAVASPALGQGSHAALRFHGLGRDQLDRVRIAIDDDVPGPDASAACDVGAGSFTVEFWLRGRLADNDTNGFGGGVETFDFSWIFGNIIVDRDIWDGSDRDWGISIAGGFVRLGVGPGDAGGSSHNTVEGAVPVLDDEWHHVACVRDRASGRLRIHVDGVLDFAGSAGVNTSDISYPNAGAPGQLTPWGPYIVLAAEKHDPGAEFPSFNGFMDEVRIWSVARSASEIAGDFDRLVDPEAPGLVAWYRFEEGAGTIVVDSSAAGSPAGELIAGVPGNGEWALASVDPRNVAPIVDEACPADLDGNGVLNVFDFLAFQSAFSEEDPAADLAPPAGVFNVFDFLMFQTLFGEGC